MRWSLVNVVRNTLLALSIGVLLPSMASACSVTPGQITKGDGSPGDHLVITNSADSMMNAPDWVEAEVFPRGHAWGLHKHGWKSLESWWTEDNDGDENKTLSGASNTETSDSLSMTTGDDSTSTSTTTPEPSSLALLGFGAIALGLGFASRRLRPTLVG